MAQCGVPAYRTSASNTRTILATGMHNGLHVVAQCVLRLLMWLIRDGAVLMEGGVSACAVRSSGGCRAEQVVRVFRCVVRMV